MMVHCIVSSMMIHCWGLRCNLYTTLDELLKWEEYWILYLYCCIILKSLYNIYFSSINLTMNTNYCTQFKDLTSDRCSLNKTYLKIAVEDIYYYHP